MTDLVERLRLACEDAPYNWQIELLDNATDEIERLRARVEKLTDRVGELEPDAVRYRWLRSMCDPVEGFRWYVCPPAPSSAVMTPTELDAAIDAAMREGEK